MSMDNTYNKDEVSPRRNLARRFANHLSIELNTQDTMMPRDEVEEVCKMVEEELNVIFGNITREYLDRKIGLKPDLPECPQCGTFLEVITQSHTVGKDLEYNKETEEYEETYQKSYGSGPRKCGQCGNDVSEELRDAGF